MSKGGPEYATGALAVHDSPAVTVVVSLGAGGPAIGRRAARAPRTKNRRIRRARDDARRGVPPRAARPGWHRANQREVPRRPPRELDSGLRSGFAIRVSAAAEEPQLYGSCRFHVGAWYRGYCSAIQYFRRRLYPLRRNRAGQSRGPSEPTLER